MSGVPSSTSVTVAVPVLDEVDDLGGCLDAIAAQDHAGAIEIVVVDGGSTDGSVELARSRADVRVVDNPGRYQSTGLNIALRQATGDVFVRVDARTVIEPTYVARCVEALDRTGAAMVGGAQRAVGTTTWGRAVASVYDTVLGSGGARYRDGGASGWVDTVYLGAYRTDLAAEVGGYDEGRRVNEDAEFALRMRPYGGVWLDAGIRSTYRPRGSLRGLARQQFRYGQGRLATSVRHRDVSPRQLVAPGLVVGLLSPWRRPVAVAYGGALVASGVRSARSDPATGVRVPVVLAVMHLSWGFGFLTGLLRLRRTWRG